jgi:hypothetical protein
VVRDEITAAATAVPMLLPMVRDRDRAEEHRHLGAEAAVQHPGQRAEHHHHQHGGQQDQICRGHRLLGTQIALAAAFGIAILRSSTALEPLASASEQDLVAPLGYLINALLPAER